jgi:flagellar biosynthesis protein FlhF
MPYFTEQARTRDECMERIRTRYGKDAKVLIERSVRKGGFLGLFSHEEVEMTGTYGYSLASRSPDYPAQPPVNRPAQLDLETAKAQVLAAAGKTTASADPDHLKKFSNDVSIQAVLKEISNLGGAVRSLNEKVDAAVSGSRPKSSVQENAFHPSLQKLEEDLLLNEFSPSFIAAILDRVRREFPLHELDNYEEVQKRAVIWIGEQISIYRENEALGKKKPRVIVLVGPTGVGKTTTLVKLAALYGERERSEGIWQKRVRLVTLDCYRIGAEYQIKKYGEIMDVPVTTVDSYDGLKQVMSLYRQDVDFVLVDTIGKSPRNYAELGEMKSMLDACPAKTEIHLCIQATTKSGDLRDILKQFEPFKYKSVVITKMDETDRIGNVISVLAEEQKCISFLTTGQTVPWDIERASVIRFLINLEGFAVDRRALVDHFRTEEGTQQ